MTSPGPHCFILILNPDRYTKEDHECTNLFFEYFGNNVQDFFIILFIKKKEILRNYETLNDYLKEYDSAFLQVVEKCHHRCIAFDNFEDQATSKQVQELLDQIDNLVVENGGGHYTNKMFEMAEYLIEYRAREICKKRETKEQAEREAIERKFNQMEDKMKLLEKENKAKEEALARLRENYRKLPSPRSEIVKEVENEQGSFFDILIRNIMRILDTVFEKK